jgi:hypothetical protein
MDELDLERLVLPALLALLVLGAFLILVTNGGEESLAPPPAAGRTAPAPTNTTPAPTRRFVKVQPGDTAASIAAAAATSVERLAELNPSIDVNALRLGQTLKLAP